MATGKENLARAITFTKPKYLPVQIDVNFNWLIEKDPAKQREIIALMEERPVNMIVRGYHAPKTDLQSDQIGIEEWSDEWKVGWLDDGHGARTTYHPLEEGYHLLENYDFPEAGVKEWFDSARKWFEGNKDKYAVGTVWFTLFERLWMLRGFNNMLMDPYIDKKNFFSLQEKVVDFNLAQINHWSELKADAVYFSDDWGSQRALLMNPDDWRRIYKPAYRKMFRKARDNGMHVFMHLCGNVIDIIPDLIDIGLNVLNPVQPQAMDIRELSEKFGGHLCFYGGIDVQGTLVNGTRDEIKKEVNQLVKLLGGFNGGYIGGTSHSIMPETPLDNIIYMFEALKEY